jgi:hypothetical protein
LLVADGKTFLAIDSRRSQERDWMASAEYRLAPLAALAPSPSHALAFSLTHGRTSALVHHTVETTY